MNNYEGNYCADDDDEYRVYCDFCDNLYIERFHKNHLKLQTHTNIIHQKKFKLKINMSYSCEVCDKLIEPKSKY